MSTRARSGTAAPGTRHGRAGRPYGTGGVVRRLPDSPDSPDSPGIRAGQPPVVARAGAAKHSVDLPTRTRGGWLYVTVRT